MDSEIFDTENLLINAEDCQRLSYEMLFKDGSYHHESNGSEYGHSADRNTSEETQHELEKLKEEWQQKLKSAKEEAYQLGLREGRQQGKEEALELMKEQTITISQSVSAVDERIDHLMEDLKPYMATMAFDVAEKIIGIPIKNEGLTEKVASEIRQILDSIEQDLKVKIAVAEADRPFIREAISNLPNAGKLEITGTDALQSGEYTIDTREEHIVKNFKKMLHDFREKVALENEQEPEEGTASC